MATNFGKMAEPDAELAALLARQDKARAMEAEIMAIVETLEGMPGQPGVKGKLVDDEGLCYRSFINFPDLSA